MELSRRRLLGATAVLGLSAACAPARSTPPKPITDPGSLIDWIAAHPEYASVLVDNGRGTVVSHLADQARPLGSAGKVVHLTAYARAVVAGTLDPDARVPVTEWERWYVPATDGFAHRHAVPALGVGPGDSVRWDDLASVMIAFSDSAAPDLFRARLGDAALIAAAEAGGWTVPDLPCFGGEGLLTPGWFTTDPPPPPATRRVAALTTLRAYADDPAWRAVIAEKGAAIEAAAQGATTTSPPPTGDAATDPGLAALLQWCDGGPAGTVTQLAAVHRAAATDALGPEVAAIVRRHLERPLADRLPRGVLGAGQKGGNLPGLITNTVTVRRADGTLGVAAISLSGMPWNAYQEAMTSVAPLVLSQQVLIDAALLDRLSTALGAR